MRYFIAALLLLIPAIGGAEEPPKPQVTELRSEDLLKWELSPVKGAGLRYSREVKVRNRTFLMGVIGPGSQTKGSKVMGLRFEVRF